MTTNRKTCRVCRKRKMYSEFYQRSNGSKDGYWNECKACTATRTKAYRYGECARCGEEYYNGGGESLCKPCRKPKVEKPAPVVPHSLGKVCDTCKFLADCSYRVRKKDAHWLPYCFVTSRYHESWLKEYGGRVAV